MMHKLDPYTARPRAGSACLPGMSLMLSLALMANAAFAGEADADAIDAGRRLFHDVTPSCAICHTLEDAGSSGAIGPVLDEIKPDAARVEQAIRGGIGQMPAYTALSDEEIKALAGYVAQASGGAP